MTTTESLLDLIEQNNIEVYLGSMPAAKSASANIGDDYYIALDEQSLESTAEARCRLAHEAAAGTPRRPVHPSTFLTKRPTATRLKTHPNAN